MLFTEQVNVGMLQGPSVAIEKLPRSQLLLLLLKSFVCVCVCVCTEVSM